MFQNTFIYFWATKLPKIRERLDDRQILFGVDLRWLTLRLIFNYPWVGIGENKFVRNVNGENSLRSIKYLANVSEDSEE